MSDDSSRIEVISPRYPDMVPDDDGGAAMSSRRRWMVFTIVFVLACAASLSYVFLRQAIYQSTATLRLTLPSATPAAIPSGTVPGAASQGQQTVSGTDQTSGSDLEAEVQVLTSRPLLAQVLERLRNGPVVPEGGADSLSALRNMISVDVQKDAGLVDVRARGHDAAFLPVLVNTWLDVYMNAQANSHKTEDTSRENDLEARLAQLNATISDKRQALTEFQRDNDIVSAKRDENAALARLKGLTDTLNKKSEEAVAAQSNLEAMRNAIARGQPVGGPQNMRVIANLEKRVEDLREQMKEYDTVYTKAYIAIDPRIQAVQKQLELAEGKLKDAQEETQRSALAEAEQNEASARDAVVKIRQQLQQAKTTAATFSAQFSENETRTQALAQLQAEHDRTQDELTRLGLARLSSTPQVQVLQRASTPTQPIAPDYLRDAAVAVGASLVLALLATWVVEFLSPRPAPGTGPTERTVHYSLVQLGAASAAATEKLASAAGMEMLPASQQTPAIGHERHVELSSADVERMLNAAEPSVQALIMLLLCGLSLDEAAMLTLRDVDLAAGMVTVPGNSRRVIHVPPRVEVALEHTVPAGSTTTPLWSNPQGQPLSVHDLDSLVTCAAHDAGISHAQQIDGHTLRHTYVAHLARQGVRLTDLEHIVGYIPPSERRVYGSLIPPGGGLPAERVKLTYPGFEQPKSATT